MVTEQGPQGPIVMCQEGKVLKSRMGSSLSQKAEEWSPQAGLRVCGKEGKELLMETGFPLWRCRCPKIPFL